MFKQCVAGAELGSAQPQLVWFYYYFFFSLERFLEELALLKKREKKEEKTDENSGHYVIASSQLPERRPLERCTLAPKLLNFHLIFSYLTHKSLEN